MTSIIKRNEHPVRVVSGTSTTNTGQSTFTGISVNRKGIFVSNGTVGIITLMTNGTAGSASWFSNSNVSITNGTNSFTVNGLQWWDTPEIVIVM